MSTRLLAVFQGLRQGEPVNAFTAAVLAEGIRCGEVFCVYEAGPDSLERFAALQERNRRADVPTFEVIATGRFTQPDGRLGCYLVFRCPTCGKTNRHGGVFGVVGAGDGHRVSHCACWPKGYYIREVTRPRRERRAQGRRQTVGHGQIKR